jgi:hypothetical protein
LDNTVKNNNNNMLSTFTKYINYTTFTKYINYKDDLIDIFMTSRIGLDIKFCHTIQ